MVIHKLERKKTWKIILLLSKQPRTGEYLRDAYKNYAQKEEFILHKDLVKVGQCQRMYQDQLVGEAEKDSVRLHLNNFITQRRKL